jgi:hypothetical protein
LHSRSDFSVYPNPATHILYIETKTPTTYRLQNIIGMTILQGALKAGVNNISLQSLTSGIYLLELTDKEGNKSVRKIVKG